MTLVKFLCYSSGIDVGGAWGKFLQKNLLNHQSSVVHSGNECGEVAWKAIECSLNWEDRCNHASIFGVDRDID